MRAFLVAVAVVIVAVSAVARATVVVPASLSELARDAQCIARGRVVEVRGRWTDDRRAIETVVSLETDAYLKGRWGTTLQFRVPGGTLGRFRNIVVGAPQFRVGQQVVVFLGARGPMMPFVLGLSQGVYRVAQDASGELMVMPPAGSAVRPGTARSSARVSPLRLEEFERDVRSRVEQSR